MKTALIVLLILASTSAGAKMSDRSALEKKHKLKFCSNPNLFEYVMSDNSETENNCLYLLDGDRFLVMDSVDDGYILIGTSQAGRLSRKIIHLKTNKKLKYNSKPDGMVVRQWGIQPYRHPSGDPAVIKKFKFVDNFQFE